MAFWGRLVLTTFLAIATAILMQNCKPVLSVGEIQLDPESEKSADLAQMGGEGYEGKIYLALNESACPDASQVAARIEVTRDGASFLRRDCQDLESPRPLTEQPQITNEKFELEKLDFELEYVRSEGVGIKTKGLKLGAYAPARREYDLGATWGVQAVPTGGDHVMIAFARMPTAASFGETTGDVTLFRREGFTLTETARVALPVSYMDPDYLDPYLNFAPLGENLALLFVKRSKESGQGLQTILIERKGSALTRVREGPWFPATGRAISGSVVDDGRLVVGFENGDATEYRVIDARDPETILMGEALRQPVEVATFALRGAVNAPAFMQTGTPGVFRVYKENAGLAGNGYLGAFELRVDGRSLSAREYGVLEDLGRDALYPMAVGTPERGVVLAQSNDVGPVGGFQWASLVDGEMRVRGPVSRGDQTGEPIGLTSMAGSASLMKNGLAFLRLPDLADDRVWMADPVAGALRTMNLYFNHSFSMGTGRFFSSGPYLLYTHHQGGRAKIGLISVPESLDE